MSVSGRSRIDRRGRHPAVGARIIPATSVEKATGVGTTPHNHFAASPYSGVTGSGRGRIDQGGKNPTIHARNISTAGICNVECFIHAAPDDHLPAGPNCRVANPPERNVREPQRRPTISVGIVPAAGMQRVRAITSSPDDHFAASP